MSLIENGRLHDDDFAVLLCRPLLEHTHHTGMENGLQFFEGIVVVENPIRQFPEVGFVIIKHFFTENLPKLLQHLRISVEFLGLVVGIEHRNALFQESLGNKGFTRSDTACQSPFFHKKRVYFSPIN